MSRIISYEEVEPGLTRTVLYCREHGELVILECDPHSAEGNLHASLDWRRDYCLYRRENPVKQPEFYLEDRLSKRMPIRPSVFGLTFESLVWIYRARLAGLWAGRAAEKEMLY